MFTFKCSTFYTIIQWNYYKHLSHFCPGVYCRKSVAKLICCWPHNSAAKTDSLQAVQFGSENWFAAGRIIWQRKLFRCRHHNFNSKCYFAAANTLLATNANSLQETQFQQRITLPLQTTQLRQRTQIRCRQHNFDSKTWFAAKYIIRQRASDSLRTT